MKKFDEVKPSKMKTVIGLAFILFAVVGLINIGYIAQSLVMAVTFIFGFVAYWFIFPGMIVLGFYLIKNRKKETKFKINPIIVGIGLFIFTLLILITAVQYPISSEDSLHVTNFNQLFWNSWLTAIKEPFNGYARFNPLAACLGGGWFGHLFAGLLNTIITPLGTVISIAILMAIALIIIFHKQIKLGFNKLKERRKKKKENNVTNASPTSNEVDNDIPPEMTAANRVGDNSLEEEMITEKKYEAGVENLREANLYSNDDAPVLEAMNETEESDGPLKEASLLSEEAPIVNDIPTLDKKVEEKILKPYQLPPLDLLKTYEVDDIVAKNEESCAANETIINATFAALKIGAKVVGHTIGPRITRYDVQVDANSSIQAIPRYVSDISQRLGGINTRFEPIVAGKVTSGLEVPNKESAIIGFKEIVSVLPKGEKNHLMIPFGKNITGEIKYADLAKFPHLLIGGATGSGKSVFVHSLIMTLIMRNTPSEVRLLLVDPKRVEFTHYKNSPFLLCPVVTDAKKAKVALEKVVEEMERRYGLFENSLTNNIVTYNSRAKEKNGEILPYIVVIVDEFADLIQQNKKIDLDIARITAKARAAGIHLVIATQRPSVDVITGVIKSNLPVRVALSVPDIESSKTIIGGMGAEQLLGNGDMLVSCPQIQASGCVRAQGCYVTEEEIDKVVEFTNAQREPNYDPRFMDLEDHTVEEVKSDEPKISALEAKKLRDEELYQFVKEQVYKREYTSISTIERENGIGFTRAGRLFKRLQDEGLVALESEASKGSKVLKENFKFEEKETKIGSEELTDTKPNTEQ